MIVLEEKFLTISQSYAAELTTFLLIVVALLFFLILLMESKDKAALARAKRKLIVQEGRASASGSGSGEKKKKKEEEPHRVPRPATILIPEHLKRMSQLLEDISRDTNKIDRGISKKRWLLFLKKEIPPQTHTRDKYHFLCLVHKSLEDEWDTSSYFRIFLEKILKDEVIPSPLEQFSILPLIPIHIGNLYFSFTNSSLFMLLTLSLVILLFYFLTKKGGGKLVPNAWQSLVELIYDFVLNLVNEQIGGLSGNVKQKFFPCILVTFLFLLFCNLQGMIPYSFTVTSHFLITLGLSFSLFIGITLIGFQKNGLHFLSFLLPAGVPLPLAPFLVLLELISYCFRALSLGIRLFANMMAGHSLVKILSGFAWTMLCMNDLFYFIGDLGPLFIVLALTGLELGVAILQAYVFTILICIYLNDAINLH
ncbi:ATP synthase subunit a [Euphorbia lathyris]|uniref:ATP synthase subunit a n=1 Tax=Euphorbia lathyris TaxID=212925 RepID=UPI0033144024